MGIARGAAAAALWRRSHGARDREAHAGLRGGSISVYSRTFEHAQTLADSLGGAAVQPSELTTALRDCDVIVGWPPRRTIWWGPRELGEALAGAGRPLVVVDLGMPRNVDPRRPRWPGLHLFNLDDLRGIVAEHRGAREAEVAHVEAIVAEEVEGLLSRPGRAGGDRGNRASTRKGRAAETGMLAVRRLGSGLPHRSPHA